jgi:pimeloyl-ACP methyl ester carboxylesterase
MSFELPPDPRTERRTRIGQWVGFGFATLLVVLIAYLAYVGYEGSRQLTDAPDPSTDCRTPAVFGWTYEAINYPIETDATLQAEEDPMDCAAQGEPAGDALESADGTRLAGWYIPSGSETGPTGPTVVLVHGWGSNKSAMLDRAAVLHDEYNLVIVDLRNHGQSEPAPTTQGLREASDVEAVVDWLETTKGPEQIALLGASMGGVTALNEADSDERIDAVIIESTHATMANVIQARLEQAGYPLSLPGSWAVLLGTLARTGMDISSADAVQAIERLDDRPVLIVTGGQDETIPVQAADDLLAAAEEAGSPAELDVCEEAGHAKSLEACPEDYPGWMLGFLERVLAPAG